MAEPRYQHTIDGQEVQEADLNVLGTSSALGPDHLLADLLRLAPYDGTNITRCIVPYAVEQSAIATVGPGTLPVPTTATVAPGSTDNSVRVRPFTAVVGTRTASTTDTRLNWEDIRSGKFVVANNVSGNLYQSVALAANATANGRIDLIYATLSLDANGASALRQVKSPSTSVVTSSSLVTTLVQTVSVAVQIGTPSGTPAVPATPSDGAGNYVIPLAYVRVASGFAAGAQVATADILNIAPVAQLAQAMGGTVSRPASSQNRVGGTVLGAVPMQIWGGGSFRPKAFIPTEFTGGVTIVAALDLINGSSAGWSHQVGGIVDDSIDWRNRIFTVDMFAAGGVTGDFPWGAQTSIAAPSAYSAALTRFRCSGQSFWDDHTLMSDHAGIAAAASGAVVCVAKPAELLMAASTEVGLYVDMATGVLKMWASGAPVHRYLLIVTSYGPFGNA